MPYWNTENLKYQRSTQYKLDTLVTQQDLQNIQNKIKFNEFYQLQPAEVLEVILSPTQQNRGKIGHVIGRLLYSHRGTQQNQKIYIVPISNNFRVPVVGQLVLVVLAPSIQSYDTNDNSLISNSYYYIDIIPFLNSINHNSVKNISTLLNPKKQKQNSKNFLIGQTFRNNPDSHKIIPNQGDTLIQSRFGAAIQFTSQNGEGLIPNILITNNINKEKLVDLYVKPDINLDGSSIYMIANKDEQHPTDIQFSTDKYETVQSISKLINDQIILNSGKIFLNSKVNEIAIFGKTNILLSANEIIGLESKTLNISNTTSNINSTNITISADKIKIGSQQALQPMVLGNKLVDLLQQICNNISTLTVIGSSGVSTIEPTLATKFTKLSAQIKKNILSKKSKIE